MLIEQSASLILNLPDCPAMATVACSPFPSERLESWRSWLRHVELQQVSKYRKKVDQELFIARRGLAREIIAQMLMVRPSSIGFSVESLGKLDWASDDLNRQQSNSIRKLDFSISRSTGIVAMAGCESARIGVDIETIAALPELEMLATQNLHPDELHLWSAIPRKDRTIAYYQLWVVKEAFAKALGVGLTQPPSTISSTQALTGLPRGTIQVKNNEGKACTGEFWMNSIGQTRRIAVVVVGNKGCSLEA